MGGGDQNLGRAAVKLGRLSADTDPVLRCNDDLAAVAQHPSRDGDWGKVPLCNDPPHSGPKHGARPVIAGQDQIARRDPFHRARALRRGDQHAGAEQGGVVPWIVIVITWVSVPPASVSRTVKLSVSVSPVFSAATTGLVSFRS